MSESDGELLDRLRAALEVTPTAPSVDEVTAVRALLDEHGLRVPVAVTHVAGSRRRRVRRAALAAALAATLVVGSAAIAVATNGPFSGTARRAASALGLPVDSPELFRAKDALATLRAALGGRNDRRIAVASRNLSRRLAELSGDDARRVGREAGGLLREADERLGAGHDRGDPQQPDGHGARGGGAAPDDRGSGHPATGGSPGSGDDHGSGPNGPAPAARPTDPGSTPPSGSPAGGSGSGGSGSDDSGSGGASPDGGSRGGSGSGD